MQCLLAGMTCRAAFHETAVWKLLYESEQLKENRKLSRVRKPEGP